MAKRFVATLFITIAVALACVFVFTLVLFLAPGLSIFGLKYVATGTHVVSETSLIAEKMGTEQGGADFSGSIRLEVDDIPVYVVFTQNPNYQIVYYDNFNGITNSKIDDPTITYLKENNGTAVIKIESFKKFIFENNNSNRYVRLLLPSAIVGVTKRDTNLTIISKNSSVNFSKEVEDDHTDPKFNDLTIETNGKVTYNTKVEAVNYSLKTINKIEILSDDSKSVVATNYTLNSTGGRIFVDRNVTGNINATTKDAKIQILSCNNFKANSGFGDIYCSKSDESIIVRGKADIETTAGIIEIGSILGTTEKSTITTKTGNITIGNAEDIEISTTRGFVEINSADNLKVTTSSGNISVFEALSSVNAKSKRGKITLGKDSGIINNPTVDSTFGKVEISSASGIVKVDIIKADLVLENKNASKTTLNIGGKLTATKLTGEVNVSVEGNADISFENFTTKSTIKGLNAGTLISVKLLNNESTTFSFDVSGADAEVYEYNENDPDNTYRIGKSTNITSSPESVGMPLLSVENKGNVVLYYKVTS